MINYDASKIIDVLKGIDAQNTVLGTNSDIRRSDTFALMFKDCLRYSPERKCWYYYNGRVWQKDDGGLIASELCKMLVNQLVQYCINEIDDNEGRYLANAVKWQKLYVRESIVRDARSVMPIKASDFDSSPYLINLQNGTFDLKAGILREHRPDDFITKIAPVEFKDNSFNDRWNSFILEIMSGDEDKARFLQQALGYTLSGDTRQECLFFLYGETTRNGKGTLMESVLGVMGDYGATVRPETITNANKCSSSHSEDLARLQGIRFANISEPPRAMQLNSSLVKTLTGGDTINARFLHENSFDFKPQFKLYINTNYLPTVDDQTVFSSNRIYVIPFERHFSQAEQDKSLKSLFATDELKSAIFSWLIEGYYQSLNGFCECRAINEAIEKYKAICDPVYDFVNNVLVTEPNGRTPVIEAHRQYINWARAERKPLYSKNELSSRLKKHFIVKNCRLGDGVVRCIV